MLFRSSFLKAATNLSDDELNEITIVDPHMKRRDELDKLSILDVHVKTKEGHKINIEIQIVGTDNFVPRILYYNSRMIADQLSRGENYRQIKKVISIVIADFTIFHYSETYKHSFKYYDKATNETLTDLSEILILELPKVRTAPSNKDDVQH